MAGLADTVAVANAAMTPEQIQLISDGKSIEIRIEVADISENVPTQDKEVYLAGDHSGCYHCYRGHCTAQEE